MKICITEEPLRLRARQLRNNIQMLTEIEVSTNQKLNELCWEDKVFRKFKKEFKKDISQLLEFVRTCEAFNTYINRKADLLEQILNM